MKILICLPAIQDYGGIINHAEHLIHGLNYIGHDVDFVKIENKEKITKSSVSRPLFHNTFSGIPLDQKVGWAFPPENRVPIRSVNWKSYTSKYDLVIWEFPAPSKGYEDVMEKMYNIKTPQIMFVHDGNMERMYPRIAKFKDKFEFFACVHPCALGNAEAMSIENRRLIVNPQALGRRMVNYTVYRKRGRTVCSFQTFKGWKRVDEFIRAIPMLSAKHVTVGGGGIEYHYMTSKNKRKEKYGRIWEHACSAGMKYIGYVSESERDDVLKSSRLLIDASWSKRYSQYGSHFNRVMVDAIIKGCIPVLRDLAMVDNGIFKPEINYIEIPYDCSTEEFAGIVDKALSMNFIMCRDMIKWSQKIIKKKFDSRVVAKRLLA